MPRSVLVRVRTRVLCAVLQARCPGPECEALRAPQATTASQPERACLAANARWQVAEDGNHAAGGWIDCFGASAA